MPDVCDRRVFEVVRADPAIHINFDTVAEATEAITGLSIAAELGMNILSRYDGLNGPSILEALHQVFDNIGLLLT